MGSLNRGAVFFHVCLKDGIDVRANGVAVRGTAVTRNGRELLRLKTGAAQNHSHNQYCLPNHRLDFLSAYPACNAQPMAAERRSHCAVSVSSCRWPALVSL